MDVLPSMTSRKRHKVELQSYSRKSCSSTVVVMNKLLIYVLSFAHRNTARVPSNCTVRETRLFILYCSRKVRGVRSK